MSKHPIDDIVPPRGRSIRKVGQIQRQPRGTARPHLAEKPAPESRPQNPRGRTERRASRLGLWVVAILCVAVLGFTLSLFFSGAKVVVTPKQRTVLLNSTFTAYQEPGVNELGYELMTISREGSVAVPATGEEEVAERASGTIVVYNNYSSADQRLVRNTRFETPEGLIYRINESIVVPGQQTEGGATVPGSVEAVVYADEAGESYNIGLSDFTIPGFRGDPRYDAFYARSKTEMTGGFNGVRKVVSGDAEVQAREQARANLRGQLLNEAFSQKPQDFELYEDGLFVMFEPLSSGEKGGLVEVREKATLYGVLFPKESFAKFVARQTVAGFDEEPVRIVNPAGLSFAVTDKAEARPWEDDSFQFTLSGSAHLVWLFDQDQLKDDLAGKAKGAFQTILTGYSSIDEAQIVLRPFWRQTFPEDVGDIKIELVIRP